MDLLLDQLWTFPWPQTAIIAVFSIRFKHPLYKL